MVWYGMDRQVAVVVMETAQQQKQNNLVEVVESLMQISHHARRRFVGDFDGDFEDALRDGVTLARRRGLGAHVDAVVRVTVEAVLLDLLLQSRQPLGHQMYILNKNTIRYNTIKL